MAFSLSFILKAAPYAIIAILLGIIRVQSGEIHKWHVQNDRNVAARAADQRAFKAAQTAADTNNRANIEKLEETYQRNSDDIDANYRAQLAQLLSANQRLREQTSANSSAAGKPNAPEPVESPVRPSPETVPLPPAELLQGQECELQLNALIDLVNQQQAIDPNK